MTLDILYFCSLLVYCKILYRTHQIDSVCNTVNVIVFQFVLEKKINLHSNKCQDYRNHVVLLCLDITKIRSCKKNTENRRRIFCICFFKILYSNQHFYCPWCSFFVSNWITKFHWIDNCKCGRHLSFSLIRNKIENRQ